MRSDLPEFLDRSDYKRRMNEALTIDPARTAVVTVDMQREYLDEAVGQSVVVPEEAERVVGGSKRLMDLARSQGMPVVHAYVERRQVELDRGFHTGGLAYTMTSADLGVSQAPHREIRRHADRPVGSAWAQVPDALTDPSDVHVTTKKSLDSFMDTDLGFLLDRILHVDTVLIAGINTDTCVYSTTFTAANRGLRPVVVSDCVASMRGKDAHWMALELMSRSIAWVLSLDEVAQKLADS